MADSPEKRRVDDYLNTIARLEPDITPIDASAYYASAAISLKRIADALEKIADAPKDQPPGLDLRHGPNCGCHNCT